MTEIDNMNRVSTLESEVGGLKQNVQHIQDDITGIKKGISQIVESVSTLSVKQAAVGKMSMGDFGTIIKITISAMSLLIVIGGLAFGPLLWRVMNTEDSIIQSNFTFQQNIESLKKDSYRKQDRTTITIDKLTDRITSLEINSKHEK